MIVLNKNQIGKGWDLVPEGQVLGIFTQFLDINTNTWRPTGFAKSEKLLANNRIHYRKPVSIPAKISCFVPCLFTYIVRKIKNWWWSRKHKS